MKHPPASEKGRILRELVMVSSVALVVVVLSFGVYQDSHNDGLKQLEQELTSLLPAIPRS